jgi:hypothetical protein
MNRNLTPLRQNPVPKGNNAVQRFVKKRPITTLAILATTLLGLGIGGMSLETRYIAQNDIAFWETYSGADYAIKEAGKKIQYLERAPDTWLSQPGINVYQAYIDEQTKE